MFGLFGGRNVIHDKPAQTKARMFRSFMGRRSALGKLVRSKSTDASTKAQAREVMKSAYKNNTNIGSKPAASRAMVRVLKNTSKAQKAKSACKSGRCG